MTFNSRQILSFIAGLLVTAAIYAVIGFLMIASVFTFIPQTFKQKLQTESISFYFLLLLLILTIAFIIKQYKSDRKFLSYGVAVSSLILVCVLFILGSAYITDIFIKEPFNKIEWTKYKIKPFNMAKTIYKQNELVGLNRKEIIQMLGYEEETAWTEGNSLMYSVDNGWVLMINLKKDVAVEIEFRERGFDL